MSLATKNQENLIHEIAITLAVHEPVNLSKLEAGLSDSQLYKHAGNSVTVPVIKVIAEQM